MGMTLDDMRCEGVRSRWRNGRRGAVRGASLLALALLLMVFPSGHAATPPATTYSNWGASSYDHQNTNYDPQDVINASNVNQLAVSWIYQVPENPFSIPGAPPALGIETQPLVVNGIVYFATPYNRLIALNSVTGSMIWDYQVNMSQFTKDPWWSGAYSISGISDYNSTIYMMASDTTVYAFDALNGTLQFTIPDIAANIPGNTGTYYGEKAPTLVGDNLIVEASTTDYGGRGFVAAYNIDTRNLSWLWFSVPPSGGDPNWDSDQCIPPQCTGNITPYPGDWGPNNLMGGGAVWGLIGVDNSTGIIYFSTGHPSNPYDASERPGPDLFTDSVIALNSTSGKMIWYYQMNSHDISEHEGGWSTILATVNINGQPTKVVIQGAKSNYIYVLNAATGKLEYDPIHVGMQGVNDPTDGVTNNANLTLSQSTVVNDEICPGPDGGIEMAPALMGDTLYVVTQNACGQMYSGPYPYKGQNINGYFTIGDQAATQNSTLYSIDLSNGQANWHDNLANRYQAAAAVVSGGVVYIVDRAENLYFVDAGNGNMLRSSVGFGGLGAAGVAIGRSTAGEMMLFVPGGGGDQPSPTPGVLVAFIRQDFVDGGTQRSRSSMARHSVPGGRRHRSRDLHHPARARAKALTSPEAEKERKVSRRLLLKSAILFSAVGAGMVLGVEALVTAAPSASTTSGEASASEALLQASPSGGSVAPGTPVRVKVVYLRMPQTFSITEEYFVLQSPARYRDLLSEVVEEHPFISAMVPTMTVLIDGYFGQPTTPLKDGDEVDFVPYMAGG